ncbi:MAG: quaternary ammonium compound efflux SMR transporter SugE [Armatimonadota bacterium]
MAWIILVVAGIFECLWAIGLPYTNGFTRLVPSLLTVCAIIVSMYLLALAARTLPIGTAYAVWTGIGTVGTAALGMYLLGESHDPARLFFLVLIVVGIVGLKFVSAS